VLQSGRSQVPFLNEVIGFIQLTKSFHGVDSAFNRNE
jgi:hypothetical protein